MCYFFLNSKICFVYLPIREWKEEISLKIGGFFLVKMCFLAGCRNNPGELLEKCCVTIQKNVFFFFVAHTFNSPRPILSSLPLPENSTR